MQIARRPETAHDDAFVRRLILQTIADEWGASAWPEPMRAQLLEMQLNGRRQPGESSILQASGVDCGWLLLRSLPDEVRIIEIMVLPEMRGRGIGAAAIRSVTGTACRPVRLKVNLTNTSAVRLYQRLGFCGTDSDGVQQCMEYSVSL
jgi:ribosomal protein S18 acetylase RimI-like enzyme